MWAGSKAFRAAILCVAVVIICGLAYKLRYQVSEAAVQYNPFHRKPTSKPAPRRDFLPWDFYEHLFFFGDSYTANGFDVSKEQPSPTKPLGNYKPLQTPTWVKYITTQHNASTLRAYNLAISGSTIDRSLVSPVMMGSTFKEQFFQRYVPNYTGKNAKVKWNVWKTVFFIWFGVNDLGAPYIRGQKPPRLSELLRTYRTLVEQLYRTGARNVIFLTVPPFDLSSDFTIDTRNKLVGDITNFNAALNSMAESFGKQHKDARFAVFDANAVWWRIIESPIDFPETSTIEFSDDLCEVANIRKPIPDEERTCKNGEKANKYVWYPIHGTYPVHNATAGQIAKDCFGKPGPRNYCK